MSLPYLTDIMFLLTAAVIVVPLSRFAGLGTVPGFLIAGMAVGPSALGLVDNAAEIGHLAELGVVLLLFVIGIELKPSRLWLMRRMVFGLGSLQVVVTGVLLSAAAHFVFGLEARAAVLVGPALALSSTAFVLQLLAEQKMLTSSYGRTSIAVLLFQDLAVVPLLALASLLTVPDLTIEKDIGLALFEALAILALIILGGRFLLQPILHRVARHGSPEIFTASAVLLVLGTAVLIAEIGLSMAMGAFVAGLLVADSEYRHQVMAEIQPFRGLFLGLFFMSMGMSLELGQFLENPLVSVGLVVTLMLIKVAVLWPLSRLLGHKGGTGLAIALLLAQSGEFALVLFAVAYDAALLNEGLFQQLLLVVVLSMLATPPLAGLACRVASSRRGDPGGDGLAAEIEPSASIVIVGFGRVGRRVGRILEMRDVRYVAVDNECNVVKRERRAGRSVFYGDARQSEVLKSLGVGNADLVIVTVDDFQVAEQVVSSLHRTFPKLDILVRGHDFERCQSLQLQGARLAVSENLEASIALGQAALTKVKGDDVENEVAIERFRKTYYASTREK
ncbi:MAG: monovalent cation:proton antiporter-2 (CPA2) family protein [Pseudomonadota bacterium]|nr:monovalent cation:proton antiporter-2 (CPA2) family protein [Pseudomonadota bacterium]